MTVVISDLVAKVRAEGVEETTAQIAAVRPEAAQTARALEIMAAQFAKLNGGTAAEAMAMFARSGVQPTTAALNAAAEAADKANSAIERTAATARASAQSVSQALTGRGVDASAGQVQTILAAEGRAEQQSGLARALREAGVSAGVARQQARALTDETQSAAAASQEVAQGWKLSESNIVRAGAGILGIGLGISLVAGAARLAHQAIVAVVEGQLSWERSLREVHALYGAIGPQIIATAQAQAALPGTLGTQQEYVQAALNARYLGSRFGLPQGSITDLTTAAGRVADFQSLTDPAARAANQARFAQFAQSGGSGLRDIGVEGDPEAIANRLGLRSAAALSGLTPQQLTQAQALIATEAANRLAATSTGDDSLLARRTQAEKALEQFQSNLQRGAEISTVEPLGPELQGFMPGQAGAPSTYADVYQAKADELTANLQKITDELGSAASSAEKAASDLAKLGLEAGSAAVRLLTFTGSLEDPRSIARGDVGAAAQAAVFARAIGPNPLIARTPAEMAATARQTAEQQAYQSYVAEQAQQDLRTRGSAYRDFLSNAANQQGPGLEAQRGSAQRALDDIQRRYLANTVGGQAQQAGAFAQRAQTEAQSSLSQISVQQDERRLEVAEQLAGYRRDSLTLEGQMAPLILAQANLQDRMAIAARDNLATRRELIAAQQQELRTTQITSAYDYEQQRLVLRAEQSRAIVAGGGAATEDINTLRQQYRATELQRSASGVDIDALDASRGVQVVNQQRTGEQLGRDATLTNMEEQGRALQDQEIPLAALLRDTQAREASVQRTLALLDLEDTKAVTAASHALNSATLLALQAGAADRAAQDMAAGMNLGATAAERWAAALEKGTGLLTNIGNMQTNQVDVNSKINNGLGGGGLGPSSGQAPSVTNTIPGFQINITSGQTQEQFKTQVHIAVEDALNRFFTGASTSGPPAPGTVGGAGR